MFNFPIKKLYIFTWFVPFNYPLSRFWKSNILTVPQKNIYTFCGNQPTNLLHLQLFLHIQQGWKKNIQHWKMTHITQYTHFFVMGQRGRYNHLLLSHLFYCFCKEASDMNAVIICWRWQAERTCCLVPVSSKRSVYGVAHLWSWQKCGPQLQPMGEFPACPLVAMSHPF